MAAADSEEHANGHAAPHAHDALGEPRPRWRNYTAFVLSGGGARGAFQVGALRALLEHGERPQLIVGTSIGAWNGAMLAHSPTLAQLDALADLWRSAHPVRVLLGREPVAGARPQAVRGMLMLAAAQRVAAGHPSLYGDAGLHQFVVKSLGEGATFEDLAIPLRVIATDMTRGARTVISSGLLAPAVLASSAIPGVFPPVRIGDTVYVDGGAVDNASIETALAMGARRIFVVDVGLDLANSGPWGDATAVPKPSRRHRSSLAFTMADVLERTVQVTSHYHLRRAIERAPRGVQIHLINAARGARGGSLAFDKAAAWIEQGYAAADEYLRAQSVPAAETVG